MTHKVVKFIECIKVCLSLPFVFFWMLIKLKFGSELGYAVANSNVANSTSSETDGSCLFDRYLSLHTRSLNSICKLVILAQKLFLLCSPRAVEPPHRLHSPHPKPQRGHLILQLEDSAADFRMTHIFFIFLFFDSRPGSCKAICGIIISNKSFSSAKAALV